MHLGKGGLVAASALTLFVWVAAGACGSGNGEQAGETFATSPPTTSAPTTTTAEVFSPPTSASENAPSYVEELDEVCATLGDSFDALSASVDTGEFEQLGATEFASIVTSLDATLVAIDDFRVGLSDIDAPPEAQRPIAAFGAGMDDLAEGMAQLRAAAEAEDATAMEAAFASLDALDTAEMDAATEDLVDLGATECGPDA